MSELLKWKLYLIGSAAFLRVESLVHQLIPFLTLPRFGFHLLRCCIRKCYNEQAVDIDWVLFINNLLIIRSTNTAVLPDPAAAATKISRPLATTAFHWSSVH